MASVYRSIGRVARDEVAELQQQLQQGTRAREIIVEDNLGLVYNRLAKFQKSSGGNVDHGLTDEDLIQEGCLALLRAAEKFDLTRGIRFSTYACTAVWSAPWTPCDWPLHWRS